MIIIAPIAQAMGFSEGGGKCAVITVNKDDPRYTEHVKKANINRHNHEQRMKISAHKREQALAAQEAERVAIDAARVQAKKDAGIMGNGYSEETCSCCSSSRVHDR